MSDTQQRSPAALISLPLMWDGPRQSLVELIKARGLAEQIDSDAIARINNRGIREAPVSCVMASALFIPQKAGLPAERACYQSIRAYIETQAELATPSMFIRFFVALCSELIEVDAREVFAGIPLLPRSRREMEPPQIMCALRGIDGRWHLRLVRVPKINQFPAQSPWFVNDPARLREKMHSSC